jgi:UDP-N-acetylglucosamine--N-acetylmuramyl-(pentapeptide) pyrophosphoryl-undecaprenol N-acetylglucosamine transferase
MTKIASRFAQQTFHSFGPEPMPLFYSPKIENGKWKMENSSSFVIRNSSLTPPPPPLSENAGDQSGSGNKILVFGGSQGAQFLNEMTMECHDKLLTKYKVTLVTGVGKKTNLCHDNLTEYEFLPTAKLAQKIHQSDLVIARGGANSLFEIISSKTPSIIIPLPSVARNHQLLNAQYFVKRNLCVLLEEKETNPETFLKTIEQTLQNEELKKALQNSDIKNKAAEIAQILTS